MPERHSHHGAARHTQILAADAPDDSQAGWMLSYLDVMTLLVALFALLLAITMTANREQALPPLSVSQAAIAAAHALHAPQPPRLADHAIAAARAVQSMPPRLSHTAIVAARAVAFRPSPARLAPPWQPPRLDTLIAQRLAAPAPANASDNRLPPAAVPAPDRQLDATAIAQATRLAERKTSRQDDARPLPSLEGVEVIQVAEGLNLRIQDRLLFKTASDELTPAGQAMIARLVGILERHAGTVSVEGHTDSQPIRTARFPSNWELSSARALAILHQLARAGIDASRLRAIGYADTRPLTDNHSAAGRAKNRRVEVIVHR